MRRACLVVWVGLTTVLTTALPAAREFVVGRYGLPPERRGTSVPGAVAGEPVELRGPAASTLRGLLLRAHGAHGTAVVLHGWGSSAADLLPLGRALQEQRLHVLLLDARGHGRSDAVEFTSMPRFAEDLVAALDWVRADAELGIGDLVLVGHSVGAGACLLAARDAPPVDVVVLLASMADPRIIMRRLLVSGGVPAVAVPVALRVVEHLIGRRFCSFAPREVIRDLDIPIVIVHGDEDVIVPVSDAYLLADAALQGELVIVPGAGHDELSAVPRVAAALRRVLAAPAGR